MAYTRDEKEKLEVDYPLEKVWAAIPQAVKALEWTIQEKDDSNHKVKLKTKGGFLSYSTVIEVELVAADDKSRMFLTAETPVTTITSMVDFGKTRDRVEQFVGVLAGVLKKSEGKKKKSASKMGKDVN
jgi:hypothetical protein